MSRPRTPLAATIACLALFGLGACGPRGEGDDDAGLTNTTPDARPQPDAMDPSLFTDDDGDGYSEVQGDCDDASPLVVPFGPEVCDDDIDNNCNGAIDEEEPDQDGDGFGPCAGDCDDTDPAINPAAPEIPGDGIDNDCDGIIDADFDGDGVTEAAGDCDDGDPDVYPGAREICFDGVDNDCNGYIDGAEPDQDGDGYGPCSGDCDDDDPTIHPAAAEIPGDGIDNNCDNLVDQDIDGDGWTTYNGDCNDDDPAINPSVYEICGDGVDNNCNGVVDTDCLSPCDLAALLRSSVGCVYYAVDTNNDPVEGYDAQQFAVVISNTHTSLVANVQVQTRSGGTWTTIQSASVSPGSLYQFNLPDRHINYTGLNAQGAYRVVSDLPVIAYQFQPVDGQSSYTSDASLLLPKSSLDRYYRVLGWGVDSYGNPQVNIAASEDNTTVTIIPTVNTAAGGPIPALSAGVSHTFTTTLNEGDYIQLEGPAGNGGFSGTYIAADKPIAVISAHWCANIPSLMCCCDHLEEQLVGLQTWGRTYVASRLPVRNSGTPEATQWHIVANEDNTTVTFTAHPDVTGLPAGPQILNAGQELYLQVSGSVANPGDFIVQADKPIMVMEYLSSSAATNASTANAGDPAMTQAVAMEQYLDSYVVLVPPNWIRDFMVITKRVGETVTLDGAPIPQSSFVTINDGVTPPEWEVARITTTDGTHNLDGTAPFGVIILGYDSYDSYAYPGGLNQQIINPIN